MSPTRLPYVLLLAGAVSLAAEAPIAPARDDGKAWHRVVGILQYLEADYPLAVESQSDFELKEQRSFAKEAVESVEALGPKGAAFRERLLAVQAKVNEAKDPEFVSKECGKLVEDLVMAGGLMRSPRRTPDLARGKELFAQSCTACHGVDGKADVPAAATMEPKPANFHDPELFTGLTPYKAFNTTSFGVTGTAMPPFVSLEESDRWSLAFFLFTLRQPECDHAPPKVSIERLATTTDVELAKLYGEKELACLRRTMPSPDEDAALLVARTGIEDALRLAEGGDYLGARAAVLDAYLNGLEPVEPLLTARNRQLVQTLEEGFLKVRLSAEAKSPAVQDDARALLSLIDQARRGEAGTKGSAAVFWQAFLILLREGFEALVVITALLAVLKKMGQTKQAAVVHAGWISAIVVGAVAFVFGQKLLAGARREWLEGVVALAAVAMLLYAAFWLNERSHMREFMGKIRTEMEGALGQGSVVGLFVVSFTAMLRESFETALFLQGLSIDAPSSAALGGLAGVGALLLLALFIRRFGYRLPMKTLFSVSTWMLFATAVVLLGKGLHALQEVGTLPLRPVPFLSVELLGIFPDAVSLVPQVLLALSPLLLLGARRLRPGAPNPVV